jgi:hypothetical protein
MGWVSFAEQGRVTSREHRSLEAKDPKIGRFRSYRLDAGTDLLGDWLVDVRYGRIGTSGRLIRYVTNTESEARKLVKESLRRRSSAKKRIGVAYRFCQLIDPHQWFPVEAYYRHHSRPTTSRVRQNSTPAESG